MQASRRSRARSFFSSVLGVLILISASSTQTTADTPGLTGRASTPLVGPSVIIVEDGDSLPDAVRAAPVGSILLIKEGEYTGLVFIQRSLVLVAEEGAAVCVQAIDVNSLPAGEAVLLKGLASSFSPSGFAQGGLGLRDCAGLVEIEDCTFTGPKDNHFVSPEYVEIKNCEAVLIIDCLMRGGAESTFGTAAPGIGAEDSNVFVFNSTILGAGAPGGTGLDGGASIELSNSFLFVQDSTLFGGPGTFLSNPFNCGPAGDGGPGIELTGTGCANLRNTVLQGGPAGVPDCVGGVLGVAGLSYVGDPASLDQRAACFASLDIAPTPLRTGSMAQVTVSGEPGQLAFVFASMNPTAIFINSLFGIGALGEPTLALGGVVLDSAGLATLTPTASLPPGVLGSVFTVQALLLDPQPGKSATLSSPTSVVILDASL